MRNDIVVADGRTYVVTFDGAHRGRDLDLFHPVDWLDPKSRIEIRAAVEEARQRRQQDRPPGRPRKYLQGWRNRRTGTGVAV